MYILTFGGVSKHKTGGNINVKPPPPAIELREDRTSRPKANNRRTVSDWCSLVQRTARSMLATLLMVFSHHC